MDIERRHLTFILLNVVGGSAVLASYAWGFALRPVESSHLWGGVPPALRPVYTTFMLLAAAGFFLFTAFFMTRINPRSTALIGGHGWALLQSLYAAILVASALWLPLTVAMVSAPSEALWWLIRLVLAIVGLASLALLAVLLASDLDRSGWLYPAAVAGLVAFCVQTAVLDAIVWPYYFR